jgi:hypothetical protein
MHFGGEILMLLGEIIGIVGEFLGIFCQKCSDKQNFILKPGVFFSLGWQSCGEQKILRAGKIPGSVSSNALYRKGKYLNTKTSVK